MRILILTNFGFIVNRRQVLKSIIKTLELSDHGVDVTSEKVSGEYDFGISIHHKRILKASDIAKFKHGVINIHPSYLPYGRGADPCIWSLDNDWPLGVTVHWIDEGIDTGNILFQIQVEKRELETGEELQNRLVSYYPPVFNMFWAEFYGSLSKGIAPIGKRQDHARTMKRSDLPIEIPMENIRTLINFHNSNYDNVYVRASNGKKYWVGLQLTEAIDD